MILFTDNHNIITEFTKTSKSVLCDIRGALSKYKSNIINGNDLKTNRSENDNDYDNIKITEMMTTVMIIKLIAVILDDW